MFFWLEKLSFDLFSRIFSSYKAILSFLLSNTDVSPKY